MEAKDKVNVLFVCLGNICRSPTAQGVFDHLACRHAPGRFATDSAGTAAYHVGEPPDTRSQAAARRRGIDLSAQRARAVSDSDFKNFDWLLAMDRDNYAALRQRCPPEYRERVRLFMSYAPHTGVTEVPDPYYGGADGFDRVLDLVEAASLGFIKNKN